MNIKSTWHWMDHVSWSLDYFKTPPLGCRSNTKPTNHGIPNVHNHWFVLFHHVRGLAWIDIHRNSSWLKTPITHDFTMHLRVCDHTTRFWRCVGTAFGHFLFGSHNFMVTTLGTCAGLIFHKVFARSRPETLNWKAKKIATCPKTNNF
jgi:hypothetical protein